MLEKFKLGNIEIRAGCYVDEKDPTLVICKAEKIQEGAEEGQPIRNIKIRLNPETRKAYVEEVESIAKDEKSAVDNLRWLESLIARYNYTLIKKP